MRKPFGGIEMKYGIALAVLMLLPILSLGCSSTSSGNLKGTTTADGHLIFYEWTAEAEKRHAVLRDGYGMMIFYDAFTENSVPRYELYVYKDKEIIKTTSLAEFKEQLALIPAGEKLHYYNTCAGGTHHGLDRSVLESIKIFCRDKGIVFQVGDDKLFSICMGA